MAKKIVWSFTAKARYRQIIEYLLVNWSERQALDFSKIVDRKLYLLARFPFLGIRSQKDPKLRKLLITKHNRLFYEVRGQKIFLLDIQDTRRADQN